MVRYTITVEDETISDHIRYVNNGQENNLAKEHEFLVEGLLPGKTNFIVMELVDSTGNTRETKTISTQQQAVHPAYHKRLR